MVGTQTGRESLHPWRGSIHGVLFCFEPWCGSIHGVAPSKPICQSCRILATCERKELATTKCNCHEVSNFQGRAPHFGHDTGMDTASCNGDDKFSFGAIH